ncbi:MAG: ATP-binding protein [Acidimicrobiales bacterium]
MTTDALLTEVERQEKYLADLPDDFTFPLFNVRHAVESQRRSGYRDTAAASREIVDNAVEAGATRIDVVIATDPGKKAVSDMAFIDNGSGMLPKMVRYALTWGGGTHFDDHNFFGRFGFGLPNSSINQGRRVEVYSRISADEPWLRGVLDISSPSKFGAQSIEAPEVAELPDFVQKYVAKEKVMLTHGTVVVWVHPDRLTYKKAATLGQHLIEDFGVTYRYHLKNPVTNPEGLSLVVSGTAVAPVDHLFLTPGARLYLPGDEGGATATLVRSLPVRYWEDADTGDKHLELMGDGDDPQEAVNRGDIVGAIKVTVARFPKGFADANADDPDAKKRFEIRKSRRGMSFVRANREIETVDVFPRSEKDKSSGLGNWPLLQSYAYYWGIEVRFDPAVDEVFGITNDKQSVRPIEDFWRVLAAAEIDDAARRENAHQRKERERAETRERREGTTTPAETAAQAADVGTSTNPDIPDREKKRAREALDTAAEEEAAKGGGDVEKARHALEEQAKRSKYRVEYDDVVGGPIYEPKWIGEQITVVINRQHQLYQVLYGDLFRLGAGRAKEAVDLLLFALARAELKVIEEEKALFYGAQRRSVWSPFLADALANLATKMTEAEEAYHPDVEPDEDVA